MMRKSDEAYFERRMQDERIRALSAACEQSRNAHKKLALLYARKWQSLQPVALGTDQRTALS